MLATRMRMSGGAMFEVVAQGSDAGATIDVTGVNFGKPHPNRLIVVSVNGRAGGTSTYGFNAGSAEIGGAVPDSVDAEIENIGGSNESWSVIMSSGIPTGWTGGFKTVSSRSGSIDYVVYRIITASGATTATATDEEATGNDGADLNLNTAIGDILIANAVADSDGTMSSTGLSVIDRQDARRIFGHHICTTAETPRTVDIDSTDTTDGIAGAAASFIVS